MSMKSLLIISRHPPSQQAGREALDMALAAAAFDIPVGLLFMDDGVLQLRQGQEAPLIGIKSLAANLQALPIFGVEDIMACSHSLDERGMRNEPLALPVKRMDTAEISALFEHYQRIISL